MDRIVEKVLKDRLEAGNHGNNTVITATCLTTLVACVKEADSSLIILYEGKDSMETVPYWNQNIKTPYATFLLSPYHPIIDPTEFQYYKPHKLVGYEDDFVDSMPKLSQCDPVCRWLGFKQCDIIEVDGELYQVFDEQDRFFTALMTCSQ